MESEYVYLKNPCTYVNEESDIISSARWSLRWIALLKKYETELKKDDVVTDDFIAVCTVIPLEPDNYGGHVYCYIKEEIEI